MMHIRHSFVVIASTGLLLAGCGDAGIKDIMTGGKYSPDETQVQANQTLAMPPNLQLRPPSGAQAQSAAAAPPQQPSNLLGTQKVTAQPPQYGAPDPNEAPKIYEAPASQTLAATAPQQPVIDETPTEPAAPDVYEKLGISKVHPDGRPKTKAELINELRKMKIEQERAKNPNYGSVFNAGNIAWD